MLQQERKNLNYLMLYNLCQISVGIYELLQKQHYFVAFEFFMNKAEKRIRSRII